jgi:pimeloyl-ACP methyl ester carboxylesterase
VTLASESRPVGAPPVGLLALEIPRAAGEFAYFSATSLLFRLAPHGDGHPVLVLPGLAGADSSTIALRNTLHRLGYQVEGWGLGRNVGQTPAILDGLPLKLSQMQSRSGKTVSIVGWSLGGVYARELARIMPKTVRQVITLGSPFRMRAEDRSNAQRIWSAFRVLHRHEAEPTPEREESRYPVPVPTTAVYTRTDGIVRWHTCIDTVGGRHENVEVYGSHCGLGHNSTVLYVVADRLAQREGTWGPFHPPAILRRFYPSPVSWRSRSQAEA